MDSFSKELASMVRDGNGAVTGHIISTTIGGKNGEPKQVVASLIYADNWAPIEKLKDGEAPLLTTCNGLEFPSDDKSSLPQNGIGHLELHQKPVCEAIPNPPLKRKNSGQDTPLPHTKA